MHQKTNDFRVFYIFDSLKSNIPYIKLHKTSILSCDLRNNGYFSCHVNIIRYFLKNCSKSKKSQETGFQGLC